MPEGSMCYMGTLVSDIAVFVLKRDVKLQLSLTHGDTQVQAGDLSRACAAAMRPYVKLL